MLFRYQDLSDKEVSKFWSYVNKDGPIMREGLSPCWVWRGCVANRAYGQFRPRGMSLSAARVSWGMVNGPIPEGMIILHACDYPPCCNPDHISIGTHSDNTADKIRKGRYKAETVAVRLGRPAVGGMTRITKVNVITTPECAAWFRALTAEKGSSGAALEFLQTLHTENVETSE